MPPTDPPTTAGTTPADPLAMQCACLQVRKAARAVTALYDRVLVAACGLRITQFTLLMAIDAVPDATIGRLAALLVMDRSTLARDLKPLEAEGLLVVSAGDDRRTRLMRLTAAGRRRLERALPHWREAQQRVIRDGLGEPRWQQLKGELYALVAVAQRD